MFDENDEITKLLRSKGGSDKHPYGDGKKKTVEGACIYNIYNLLNTSMGVALVSELRDLEAESQARIASVERQIAVVEAVLAEAGTRRQVVVRAPATGTVTKIQVERGGLASPSVALLSIVPVGSKLEAHLFGPAGRIQFVRPGQRVLLLYRAQPYRTIGHHEGVVTDVFPSPVKRGELPELFGSAGLLGSGEPIYRITVSLSRQTVTAFGLPVELKPGMQLDAEVHGKKRTDISKQRD